MTRKQLVENLTLVLFYLNSWVEDTFEIPDGRRVDVVRAWKGADWDVIDALRDADLIDCSNKAKSVYLTTGGIERAKELIEELGLAQILAQDEVDGVKEPVTPGETGDCASKTVKGNVPAFTFRLTFVFYEHACWRDLRVPKAFTFEDFHTAIQACLSWLNYHLYDFKFTSKGKKYQVSWPDFQTGGSPLDAFENFWPIPESQKRVWADAAEMRLDAVFPRTRKALYSYDYGDGWEIEVRLIDSKTPLENENPRCIGGEGDNPPEDVGAEWGFDEFLRVIADPDHPEHDEMVEWGEGQTFEHFDLERTNDRLSRYNDWRVQGVYD